MDKVFIPVDNMQSDKEILSSMNKVRPSPKQVIWLHVQQIMGNAMMTVMMSSAKLETLKESIEDTGHEHFWTRREAYA